MPINDNLRADLRIRTESGQTTRALRRVEDGLRRVENESRRTASSANLLRNAFLAIGGTLIVRNILQTAVAYEQLRLRLRFFSRDAQTAGRTFQQLNEYAARTPFALQDIVGQFIALQNLNVTPTIEQVSALGDIAAAAGLDFEQFGMAISSAIVGQFEPIRRAGIFITKEGENLQVTFRGVTTEIENSSTAIVDYLTQLGQSDLYRGAAEQLSTTLGGAISTTLDNLRQLADTFAGGAIREALVDFNRDIQEGASNLQEFARISGEVVGTSLQVLRSEIVQNTVLFGSLGTATFFALGGINRLGFALSDLILDLRTTPNLIGRITRLLGPAGAIAIASGLFYVARQHAVRFKEELEEIETVHQRMVDAFAREALRFSEESLIADIRSLTDEADEAIASIQELRDEFEALSGPGQVGRQRLPISIERDIEEQETILRTILQRRTQRIEELTRRRVEAVKEETAASEDLNESLEATIARKEALLRVTNFNLSLQIAEFERLAEAAERANDVLEDTSERKLRALAVSNFNLDQAILEFERLHGSIQDTGNLLTDLSERKLRALAVSNFNLNQVIAEFERLNPTIEHASDLLTDFSRRQLAALAVSNFNLDQVIMEFERLNETVENASDLLTDFSRRRLASLAVSNFNLDQAIAEFERLNEETEDDALAIDRLFRGIFQRTEDALIDFVRTGKTEFSDLINSILEDIARLALRQFVLQPLFAGIAGAFGVNVPITHSGLEPYGTPSRYRTVDPSIFLNAPRLHQGLASDEFPAILQRGEEVIPRGESSNRNPQVFINIDNQSSAELEFRRQETRIDADQVFTGVVIRDIAQNGPILQNIRQANRQGLLR